VAEDGNRIEPVIGYIRPVIQLIIASVISCLETRCYSYSS